MVVTLGEFLSYLFRRAQAPLPGSDDALELMRPGMDRVEADEVEQIKAEVEKRLFGPHQNGETG